MSSRVLNIYRVALLLLFILMVFRYRPPMWVVRRVWVPLEVVDIHSPVEVLLLDYETAPEGLVLRIGLLKCYSYPQMNILSLRVLLMREYEVVSFYLLKLELAPGEFEEIRINCPREFDRAVLVMYCRGVLLLNTTLYRSPSRA